MKKKILITLILCAVITQCLHAQTGNKNIPITIGVFSESISLPNFKNILKKPNIGFKIGTEFNYSSKSKTQLIQTVSLGAYFHKGLHNAVFVKSELGYRKFYGRVFSEVLLGGGYSLQKSMLPSYKLNLDGNYSKLSKYRHVFLPTISLGTGYQKNVTAIFSRYEIFGETPFNFNGNPFLIHKAIELGSRTNF